MMKQFHKSENIQIFSECEEVVLTEKSKALLTVNSSQAVICSLLFISFSTDPITLKKEEKSSKVEEKISYKELVATYALSLVPLPNIDVNLQELIFDSIRLKPTRSIKNCLFEEMFYLEAQLGTSL
jgi:hypothetical protein